MFFHFSVKKTLQIRSHLINSVNKTIHFCNLKVVFLSRRKLKTLFLFKDAFNKKSHSFLVYRYKCSYYNVTYYGKTYCDFFTRAAEHMGFSDLTRKRLKNVKDSIVSDHLLQWIGPLTLIISIFWLLTSVTLISSGGEFTY